MEQIVQIVKNTGQRLHDLHKAETPFALNARLPTPSNITPSKCTRDAFAQGLQTQNLTPLLTPGQAPKMHLHNHKIAPLTDEGHGGGEHEGEHETPE